MGGRRGRARARRRRREILAPDARFGRGASGGIGLETAPMPPLAPLTLALYEPDIAPNAGAMLRTCACFAVEAAIIEPAGFVLTDSALRHAGMDYLDALTIVRHASFARFERWRAVAGRRLALLTTKGDTALWDFAFRPGDVILVGRESAGAPDSVHAVADARIRIPIAPPLRSLNVAVAAALALGEARRQLDGPNPAGWT